MPHIKAKATKALALFMALAILAGAIPAVTAYAATPTLRVKMDAASRPLYHGATGWLYGQGADNVPTSNVIAPLKPNTAVQKPPSGMQHPDGDVLDIAGTFLDSGGKWLQIYVPDWYALWYYEFTGTDAYMDILLYEAQAVIDAGYADKAVWVLYNEPSSNWITNVQPGGYEGETGWNSMFHFWEDMVDALRELYAANGLSYRPLTCGLNLAGWDTGVMSSFLQYCVTNDCYPDIISWHELSTGQFNSFPSHYASYRNLESQYLQGNSAGVDPTPREIVINEYADRAECSSPGNLARWIGLWEDYEVGGCLPFWHFSNNLNGLAADSNEGNGAWWLYKWYGDMSGSYKPVTASGASKQDFYGAASYDENKKLATAIFGGQSGDGEIIFENITGVDAYSGTSQVHVKIEVTDWTGFHGAAPEPRVVAEGAIEVTSGSVTVPVTGMLAKSGYRVTVTPSDPSEKLGLLHSGWKGHFEAEAGTLGGNAKLQTNSSAYAVSGGSSNNRVGYVDLASDSVTNSISVPYSGWYRYDLVYSAATGVNTGDPASSNPLNAIMHLYLDGASDPVLDLLLESTELWDMFGMHTEYLYLEAGAHLLKLTGNGSSAAGQGQGVPDCFYLTYEGAELADTYFDMDYEAEMGEFNAIKSATTLSTIFEGGTGYVSGLELKSVPDGGGLRFTAVVPDNGMYKATLRYKSSASAAAKIYVGNDMANLTNLVAELGLPQAADPSEAGMLIFLEKGVNIIDISATSAILLDKVRISKDASSAPAATVEAESGALTGAAALGSVSRVSAAASGGAYVSGIKAAKGVELVPDGNPLGIGRVVPTDSTAEDANALALTVNAPAAGKYKMLVYQSNKELFGKHDYNAQMVARYASFQAGSSPAQKVAFRNTYSDESFRPVPVDVTLAAGSNTIKIWNDNSKVITNGLLKSGKSEHRPENIDYSVLDNYTPNFDKFEFYPIAGDAISADPDFRALASATGGGYALASKKAVAQGGSVVYTIVPDNGYEVEDAILNEKSVKSSLTLSGGTLTVSNVTEDQALKVYFTESAETLYLYSVNCGDINPATLNSGDYLGKRNSLTDQVFGVDPATGFKWGVVDPDSSTKARDNSPDPFDGDDRRQAFRFLNGKAPSTDPGNAIVYKFECDPGVAYDIELGFYVPSAWTNSSNPRTMQLWINGESVISSFAASNDYNSPYVVSRTVTADNEGFITLNIGHAANAVWGPVVSYIDIYLPNVAVTFNSNGGSDVPRAIVAEGGTIELPDPPEKPGLTFAGWYLEPLFITPLTEETLVKESITVFAKWLATISFDTDGAAAIPDIQLAEGEKASSLPTPAKGGFAFDGWLDPDGNEFGAGTVVSSSITLKAKWVSKPTSYLYSVNCGDIDPNTLNPGDVLGLRNSVTDQFFGADPATGFQWGVVDTFDSSPMRGTKTWPRDNSPNPVDGEDRRLSYRFLKDQPVSSDPNNAIIYKFECEPGATYYIEMGFYVPSAWTNSSSPRTMQLWINGESVISSFVASNDYASPYIVSRTVTAGNDGFISLNIGHAANAVWGPAVSYIDILQPELPGESCTVTFDSNGGTGVDPAATDESGHVALPDAPTKTGLDFGGWYLEPSFETEFTESYIVKEDITVYAKWLATISFVAEGAVLIPALQVAEGEKAGSLPTPAKGGFAFDGWLDPDGNAFDPDTAIMASVELTAKWAPAETSYIYSVNCGDLDPNTLNPGDYLGTQNSVTDQLFGVDAVTGYQWGVVDPDSSTKTRDNSPDPFDGDDRRQAFRYLSGKAASTDPDNAIVYKFECEPGVAYELELGFYVPSAWTNSSNPRTMQLWINGESVISSFAASNDYTNPFIISQAVTADSDGFITLNIGHAANAVWGPVVSYIDILELPGESAVVAFDSNGGTGIDPATADDEGHVALPDAPTKTGLDFGGWFLETSFETEFTESYIVKEDVIVYAKWLATISFVAEGAVPISALQVAEGEKADSLPTPAKGGFAFDGWVDPDGNAFDPDVAIMASVELTAKWAPAETSYIYSVNCGDLDPNTLNPGDYLGTQNSVTDQLFGVDTVTGYQWGGVDPDSSTKTRDNSPDPFDGDDRRQAFRYLSGKAASTDPDNAIVYMFECEPGVAYELELGFYVPSAWTNSSNPRTMQLWINGESVISSFAASNDYTNPFIISQAVTADSDGFITLNIGHAANAVWGPVVSYIDIWASDELPVTPVIVAFESNSGTEVDPATADESGHVALPDAPTKTGLDFGGWFLEQELLTAFDEDALVTESITVYAKWLATVTFNAGDEDPAFIQLAEGEKIEDLPVPAKDGFAFLGWFDEAGIEFTADTEVLASIALTAKWSENLVTVSFDSNGGSAVEALTLPADGTLDELPAPTKDGFSFAGWHLDESLSSVFEAGSVVDADITLYAKWEEETVDPVDPEEPPVDPVDPEEPPVDPVDPEEPPVDPVDPEEPPTDPVDPEEPPVDPVDPEEPPVDPGEPENPPVVPETPSYYSPPYEPYVFVPTSIPSPTPIPREPIAPIAGLSVAKADVAVSIADELRALNLFVGTGTDENGYPTYELDRPMTRIEALAALIRLMGLEDEAGKSTAANPFNDVPDWADRIAAYAFSTGLAVGLNEEHTLLGSSDFVTPHDFTVFLLRILGYLESSGDFEYSGARKKAVEAGLLKVFESAAINADGVLLRAEAVVAMADALVSHIKASDLMLVEKLVSENKLSRLEADAFLRGFRVAYKR